MTIPNFKINCPDSVMDQLEKHCFSETKVEVGGFIVGHIRGEIVDVTAIVPAEHAVGQSTQLTFTHDTWSAFEVSAKELDGTLIGWYHSHPNFGVFLSDHDQFIQQNFFKRDGNITIVVDPIRGRKGWFYSSKGKIVKYKSETDTSRPRLGKSATSVEENMEAVMGKNMGGVSMGKVVLISTITSLLGAFLGFGLNNMSTSSSSYQTQINDLNEKVDYLLQFAPTPKVVIPTEKPKPTASPKNSSTKAPAPEKTTKAQLNKACNPKADKKPVGILICDSKTSKWIKLPAGDSVKAPVNESGTVTNG